MNYLVDPQFAEEVSKWSWTPGKHGHLYRSWSKGGKGHELMHRMVWRLAGRKLPERPLTIDHINRDPSDNRLENLRAATQTLQLFNTRDRSRSRHSLPRGVYFYADRVKQYGAKVCCRGRQIYCGYYATPEDAAAAVEAKRKELVEQESLLSREVA